MFYGFEYFAYVLHRFHVCVRLWGGYWSSTFSSGYPIFMRYSRTLSRWSPCSITKPFFAVPPHAQKALSLWARSARSVVFSSMPSMTVVGLPNFLVSSRMRIRCCSFSISPQTHKSFGSPHVGQTSAMALRV